jgi:uncharacterized MAPEG superfamily protein
MGPTLAALLGFTAWFVALTLAVGFYRVFLVFSGRQQANTFTVDGTDLPGLGHRATRARNNCYETLPAFAAIALIATVTQKTALTDPLAPWLLLARIAQSVTHLISTSVPAVVLRATLFFTQSMIYAWWCWRLFTELS